MKTKHIEGLSQIQEDYFYLHWISHVSSLKTLKEMFDAITSLYEGNNISRKMTLRTQLKDVKMQMSEINLQNVAKSGPILLSM